jgi:hypothetical protein
MVACLDSKKVRHLVARKVVLLVVLKDLTLVELKVALTDESMDSIKVVPRVVSMVSSKGSMSVV